MNSANQELIQNLEELYKFRKLIHKFPEVGFKEYETQKRIKEFLISKGLNESQIKPCAGTGLIVNLVGQAPAQGKKKTVAFRADIDALSITEQNPDLEYKSVNQGAAHSCGHDGHITCLLSFFCLYIQKLKEIPNNKTIRLLFQPCEEGPESGAKVMIEEGCLNDVDEVYGFHNWPTHFPGYLMVKPGPVMSEVTVIKLQITGKGGHGSEPQNAIDPIQVGVDLHVGLRKIQNMFKGRKYVCTLPVFQGGERMNVIPSTACLQGSLRSLEKGLTQEFKNEFIKCLEELVKQYNCKYDLSWQTVFPIVDNHQKEAEHVERVAKKMLGNQNVGIGILPVFASEDFSFYLLNKPGAFFFLGSAYKENDLFLHSPNFNFNEKLIEIAGKFWLELAYDRLFD